MSEPSPQPQAPDRLSLTRISVILAVLTGLPVYPLSVAALTWQLGRTYGLDFTSAAHAASLVPTTVVILQGVRTLLAPRWLVYSVVILLVMFLGQVSLHKDYSPRVRRVALMGAFAVFGGLLWWGFANRQPSSAATSEAFGLLEVIGASAQGITFAIATGIIERGLRWGIPLARWVWKVYLWIYLGMLVMTFVNSGVVPPPVAPVTVTPSDGPAVRGELLAHTDGYWYVFAGPSGELRAIPDDGVRGVTLHQPPTPTPSPTPTRTTRPSATPERLVTPVALP